MTMPLAVPPRLIRLMRIGLRRNVINMAGGLPRYGDSLLFAIESNAGTPGLSKTFEFWNFAFGQFDTVSSIEESFNVDEVVVVEAPPLARYLYLDLDGCVRARVGWRQSGFLLNFPWEVRIDHAFFAAEN